MIKKPETKQVIIIDRHNHWRNLSNKALASKGYAVSVLDNYDYPPYGEIALDGKPDLVILGCASIGAEELKLIEKILDHKHHLVILCTSLPRHIMRSLFLIGADDVVDRPYEEKDLVEIVEHALGNIESRTNYQLFKEEGLL
jgi:DNA-binding response OmpR family regulator